MLDRISGKQHPYKMPLLMALAIVLVAQIVWTARQIAMVGFSFDAQWRPVVFTTVFLLVAATRGEVRVINVLGRLTIAGAFFSALWNRFANFPGFIRYAARVLSFVPASLVPMLAVIATACEVGLCVAMVFGFRTRWSSGAAGVLLFMFATSMVISGLSQFEWAVYVLAAGAFVLTTVEPVEERRA